MPDLKISVWPVWSAARDTFSNDFSECARPSCKTARRSRTAARVEIGPEPLNMRELFVHFLNATLTWARPIIRETRTHGADFSGGKSGRNKVADMPRAPHNQTNQMSQTLSKFRQPLVPKNLTTNKCDMNGPWRSLVYRAANGSCEPTLPNAAQRTNVGDAIQQLPLRLKVFARQQRCCADHERAASLVHQAKGKPL